MCSAATSRRWAMLLIVMVPSMALVDAGCQRCLPHDRQRDFHLQAFKANLLKRLDMKKEPNMTGRVLPPVADDIMLEFERQAEADQRRLRDQAFANPDDELAEVKASLCFAGPSPRSVGVGGRDALADDILFFNMSTLGDTRNSRLSDAVLTLHVRQRPRHHRHHSSSEHLVLQIQKVVFDGREFITKVVQTEEIHPYQIRDGVLKLEVRDLVRDWVKSPADNHGIVVHVWDEQRSTRRHRFITRLSDAAADGRGLPMLKTSLERRRRVRRSAGGDHFCSDSDPDTRCCRYPLVVDFGVFQWNWVIAPRKYEAFYCAGDCPPAFLQQYPHTQLAQSANATSSACCGPRKLSHISMIYWSEDNAIKFVKVPNMIVNSCGCY